MIEFIDKTTEQSGTPLNRLKLMAVQGFVGSTIVKNPDGSITYTNQFGETLTTRRNEDGSITSVFTGEKTITKTTRVENGMIVEEVY